MFWYIAIYYKTAPELIGKSITDNYMINMLDPLFIGLPLSFLLCIVVSYIFKQDKEEVKVMEKAFENI
ncbi:MAG: hypothetical protein BV457_09225 [Thermoplasmata archaeon M9B1D]|nr:MAG: hypothetical protein BV457_09225 [Thermoplasmata archaeon M9B1D]